MCMMFLWEFQVHTQYATCVNVNNMTSYKCQCQSSFYYGTYCENKVKVCLNKICSGHGYCIVVNETVPACKCYKGYQGDFCDQKDLGKTKLRQKKQRLQIFCK